MRFSTKSEALLGMFIRIQSYAEVSTDLTVGNSWFSFDSVALL